MSKSVATVTKILFELMAYKFRFLLTMSNIEEHNKFSLPERCGYHILVHMKIKRYNFANTAYVSVPYGFQSTERLLP